MGEAKYNRLRMSSALSWISNHSARFFQLSAQRIWYYWFPSVREGWQAYGYWAITILAIAGFWFSRRDASVRILALSAVVYSLPYAFFQADVRYRAPSLWMTALLAGGAVEQVNKRTKSLAKMGRRDRTELP